MLYNYKNISQYYCIFDQINAAFVCTRALKKKKCYQAQLFLDFSV